MKVIGDITAKALMKQYGKAVKDSNVIFLSRVRN